jgi:CCR4-NOT transcription complex subunit 2
MESQRNARQYNYGGQAFSSEAESSQITSGSGAFGNSEVVESPAGSQDVQSLDQMSEADKFGFAGLMAKFQDPVPRQWIIGQDLSALDTRINSSEPMYQSWTTPFTPNSPPSRPLESDYTIPDCYNVANVTPLRERISGFTEETLFYIFYSMPRDLMQVLVAEELIGRRWRYHKGEKQWLTRDESHELPREVDPGVSEIGYYLWWDEKQWKKIRKQHLLRYEDLENDGDNGLMQHTAAMSSMAMARISGGGAGAGGLGAGIGSAGGFGAMATSGGGGLMGLGRGM